MVDLSYMSRDRVIQDLARNRLGNPNYGSSYLGSKYGDQGLSNILNEFGINYQEVLNAADRIESGEVSPPSGTQPPPVAIKQVTKNLTPSVKPPTLPSPGVKPPTTGGVASINIGLPGTGDSLKSGNESGILSIGTPGTEFNELGSGSELGSGLDVGSGFGPATFNLQEAIRDQARAAEDEAARTGPSLAEQQQQVRNTFLEALQSQEGQGDSRLGKMANVASTGITVADKLGIPVHPLGTVFTGINSLRNFANQYQQDKLINDPSWLGTLMRSMGLENFPGVHPTVPRGGGLPFHPTPAQSRVLSSDPVSLPPKRQPVTTEDLPPPSDDLFSTDFGFSPEEMSEDFGGIV